MVDKPGIYQMSLAEYIADPAPEPSLSASVAHKLIVESPIHSYIHHPRLNPGGAREESAKMDLGTAAHGILLEGDESRLVIIEAEDFKTKVARETRDSAREAGLVPILAGKMGQLHEIVNAARSAIANSEIASAFTKSEGKAEQTLVWQEGDVWLRSRPDWLTNDRRLILDYKTTAGSAEPSAWMRGPMLGNGCDLQAALGLRGLRKLLKAREPKFVFMVQECEPPYAMSFVGLSPSFLEMAEHKLDRAIRLWGDCVLTNTWPGYPSRVAWVDPPAWAYTEEEMKV